jgi:hypothetical protein
VARATDGGRRRGAAEPYRESPGSPFSDASFAGEAASEFFAAYRACFWHASLAALAPSL